MAARAAEAGTFAGRAPIVKVRETVVTCAGVALSVTRSRTVWSPSVSKTCGRVLSVPSSNAPSSSMSHS